ncbi:hypothetical protein [Lewinella sp. LCG006]|uniref:hypothetical protein n=1 Tax=Lewinella sp. LCG006 TaxID=3231911 RepID=UPI00345F8FEA
MTAKQHYSFAIALIGVIALVHQYSQKILHLSVPWMNAYLDDILCMPLFLAIWQWEKQLFWKTLYLRKKEIAFFTCFIFILFEGILPHYSMLFTADWRDGLAYCCGSSIFYLLQKLTLK